MQELLEFLWVNSIFLVGFIPVAAPVIAPWLWALIGGGAAGGTGGGLAAGGGAAAGQGPSYEELFPDLAGPQEPSWYEPGMNVDPQSGLSQEQVNQFWATQPPEGIAPVGDSVTGLPTFVVDVIGEAGGLTAAGELSPAFINWAGVHIGQGISELMWGWELSNGTSTAATYEEYIATHPQTTFETTVTETPPDIPLDPSEIGPLVTLPPPEIPLGVIPGPSPFPWYSDLSPVDLPVGTPPVPPPAGAVLPPRTGAGGGPRGTFNWEYPPPFVPPVNVPPGPTVVTEPPPSIHDPIIPPPLPSDPGVVPPPPGGGVSLPKPKLGLPELMGSLAGLFGGGGDDGFPFMGLPIVGANSALQSLFPLPAMPKAVPQPLGYYLNRR